MSLQIATLLETTIRDVLATAGVSDDTSPIEVISHGQSGDLVAQAGALVVKLAPADLPHNMTLLQREIDVLRWLGARANTPAIVWTGPCEAGLALISQTIAGTPVSHVPEDQAQAALIATIEALAALHALPPADCPFDTSLPAKFALAEQNVEAGLVDEDDFDGEREGWSAQRALAHAHATRPATEHLVLTHGDASLPNFIWSPGQPVTLLDLGRFGLADRYQDLALFLRSTQFNHPNIDARALLRAHYPLPQIDEAACDFYRLMDELF